MPLDWNLVRDRYRSETALPPVAGTRTLTVVGVDDAAIHVASSFWTKSVARADLERAIELIEDGAMTRRWQDFVEHYGELVTGQRRSLAARILVDLGELS